MAMIVPKDATQVHFFTATNLTNPNRSETTQGIRCETSNKTLTITKKSLEDLVKIMCAEDEKSLFFKKGTLINRAITSPAAKKILFDRPLDLISFANPKDFLLTKDAHPAHFKEIWTENHKPRISHTNNFYLVNEPETVAVEHCYLIFGHRKLGGGILTNEHGPAQEEILFYETPDALALLLADSDYKGFYGKNHTEPCDIRPETRVGNPGVETDMHKGVLGGSPNPRALFGVHRVMKADVIPNSKTCVSRAELAKRSEQEIIDGTNQFDQAELINLVSVAAPNLNAQAGDFASRDKREKTIKEEKPDLKDDEVKIEAQRQIDARLASIKEWQFKPETLMDIYNSIFSAMLLAKECHINKATEETELLFHSGQFGCGVFENDAIAVKILHNLASAMLNIQVKMHGYSEALTNEAEQIWARIEMDFIGRNEIDIIDIISKALIQNRNEKEAAKHLEAAKNPIKV